MESIDVNLLLAVDNFNFIRQRVLLHCEIRKEMPFSVLNSSLKGTKTILRCTCAYLFAFTSNLREQSLQRNK